MARRNRIDRGLFTYTLDDGTVQYGVRLYRHGRPYKKSGFPRKQEARDWYEERRKDIRDGRPFPTESAVGVRTLAMVLDAHLVKTKANKGHTNERGYAIFWRERLGRLHLDAILPAQIESSRMLLAARGLAPSTINRYTAWLHHVFQVEIDLERLRRNPCRLFITSPKKGGMKLVERPAPEQRWSNEELAILGERLGADILVPLLALLTGLRQEEQFALAKDRLDLDRGIGYLDDPKAGTNQVVYFNEDAVTILRYFIAQSGESPWVFPSPRWPKTHHRSGQDWYARVFKVAAKAAGLTIGRQHGKTWHTLRHSFADRLVDLKVHIKDVKDAGRWESWQAMSRYLKRSRERVVTGVQLLKSPLPLGPLLTIPRGTAQQSPRTRISKEDTSR